MTLPTRLGRHAGVLVLVAMLAIAAAGPPVAAQADDEPAFIVAVNADGSAEVLLRLTFDLTTDDEQQAFQTLQNDDQARQNTRDRFLSRLQSVASQAAENTGREMQVTDASVDLRTTAEGDTGVVTLSVTWSGLAAVEDDRLVVTEPFASGFIPERPFVLRAPDGYEIAGASPSPDQQSSTSATWEAGTALGGFSVELTSTGDDDGGVATDGQPGFGIVVALVGVLLTVGVLRGRARRRGRS